MVLVYWWPFSATLFKIGGFIMKKVDKNSKEYLLEWQNALLPGKNTELVLTKKQLIRKTAEEMDRCKTGIAYCKKVLKTATDPNVYFENFIRMTDGVKRIKLLSRYHKVANERALDSAVVKINKNKDEAIKNFLNRSFNSVKEEVEQTGDKSLFDSWFKTIEPYKEKFSTDNLELLKELQLSIE